jgi:2,6-dihydroxypseudooxynicotine hydrolase
MATEQKDKRVEIAIHNWAPRFVSAGVPLADFAEVTAAITHWDEWCAVWSARAAVHEQLGREALREGYTLSASAHLTRASLCYHFGKFMFVHKIDEMRRAHEKVVECRNLALPYLDPPGERVAIPYESRELYGILRRPHGIETPAVVIMCVGLDSTKEELDVYENIFLERGMATLAFDGPGQGEGQYDFAIRGDYEAPVAAVVDFIETRRDLDAARIGLSGVSLGGYYAPRAAAFEKRIKACMALGGPFNWAEAWAGLPALTREAFRVRSRCETEEAARAHAASLRLEGVAARITCPIFIMNGRLDRIVQCADAERLAREVKGPAKLLIIEDGNHIANNRSYRWRPLGGDWMAEQLRAA